MRRPNPSAVTDSLVEALLPQTTFQKDRHPNYHDVVLKTSDNHEVPAFKSILALRSPFFSRLFFAPFSESTSPTVAVDIAEIPLIQVLHFIYSDDSPVLRRLDDAIRRSRGGSKARRKAWASLHCCDVELAVAVVAAADFCQLETLTEWGCSLIKKAVRVKRGLSCIALEAIVSCQGVCGKLAEVRVALLKYIVKYIPGCLASPIDTEKTPLSERECYGYAGKCALLHLGEDSMKILFDCLKEHESPWLSMAVLFDALYFWASGGQRIGEQIVKTDEGKVPPKNEKDVKPDESLRDGKGEGDSAKCTDEGTPVSDVKETAGKQDVGVKTVQNIEIDKESTRWKTAMACASMMKAPHSSFLVSCLEPSGLLSQDVLYRFYRDVTLRSAEQQDGK